MQKTDLKTVNLNLLIVLQALLDRGTVSGAADQLNLSQPAVSRSLAQLRELFDDQLFVRASHGMVPTARTEALATPLSEVLQSTIDLLATDSFTAAQSHRVFRIATTDYGATAVLAPALNRFMTLAPLGGLEVVPFAESSFDALGAGKVDLLLYGDGDIAPYMRKKILFDENYVCLVRKDHPILRQSKRTALARRMTLANYLAWPHALVTVFGGRRGVVDALLAKQNKVRRVGLWIPYFSVAPLMIAETDAILTIPSRVAKAFDHMSSLVEIPAPIKIERFRYFLVWHERTDKDPALVWLRNLLEEAVQDR